MAACMLALAVFSGPTLGQERQATALKTKEAITVDGRLEEPVWNEAVAVSDFVQFEPERGRPASVRTVVRIVYDGRAIYFGFENHDPEPGRIAARLSKRDSDLTEDDSVAVCLDTYLDKRNSYYFLTNPLGTQYDGRITENGLTTDTTWDGVWKSGAVRTEYGWSAEIAVEFASLKYKPGEGRSWGLALARVFPRRLESSFWQGEVESPYKVSQFGRLSGLDLEAAPKTFRAVPHVTTKVEEGEPSEFEAGLDARYALSQLVSADLTVNPDFATVEADQEQINLTRFELDLPEKRTFFLEGSEIYRQRITLFYSRRIGDIYAGAKVYGKSGGFEFSGLTAQTRPDDLSGTDSANFSVLRLKRDIFRSSTLGFLAANKLVNGRNQGTAGLDTSLYFTKTLQFTGQLAMSYGEHGTDNVAFFLRPSYDSATGHFHVRYTQLGRYFGDNANAVGFIRDDNRRELDSALEKTFWVKKGPFERLEYGSNYNIYWGMEGTLRSWQVDEGLTLDLRNKVSLAADYTEEYKLFEKDFRNRQIGLTLGYNTREWQAATLAYSFGRNFDLDFRLVEGRLNYRLGRTLSLEYALTRLVFNPDPEGETTWIHVLRATNYLSSDLFFKVFLQTNSAIDKFNIQLLFVYRFQPPFGLIQVAYQKGTARLGFRGTQGHTLFVKFAYMF